MYKCNEQRDISEFNKLDVWLNRGRKYTIRKKGVIEVTKKELGLLYDMIGNLLGRKDCKKEIIIK